MKLITKIRNEYGKLQKENGELKIELQKYQDYIQNKPQRSYQKLSYQKLIRKRKHDYYDEPNLNYRLAQLKNYIFQKHIYRIPLSLICDLGVTNFSFKTDLRIISALERNMNKLFESNKK